MRNRVILALLGVVPLVAATCAPAAHGASPGAERLGGTSASSASSAAVEAAARPAVEPAAGHAGGSVAPADYAPRAIGVW